MRTRRLTTSQRRAASSEEGIASSLHSHDVTFRQREILPAPITHADNLSGQRVDEALVSPSVYRAGVDDFEEKGPAFQLLPPPGDHPYSSKAGALQPALRSRLDPAKDVRMQRRRAAFANTFKGSNELEYACMVPAPFCRALRIDARVRASSVSVTYEPLSRQFERCGMWKNQVDAKKEYLYLSLDKLQEMAKTSNHIASGTREALLRRMFTTRGGLKQPTEEELEKHLWLLSVSQLRNECKIRMLPTFAGGNEEDQKYRLVRRIMAFTTC